MNQKIMWMSIGLWVGLFTLPAGATGCANGHGDLIIGNDGVSKYCLSKVSMNWWSAFAWCDAAGGKLWHLTECDRVNNPNSWCANLEGRTLPYYFWTADVYSASHAYLKYGNGFNTGPKTSSYSVMCVLP